jgi:hypothetical protein
MASPGAVSAVVMTSAASSDFILISSSGVSVTPKLKTAADVLLKADTILLQVAVRLVFFGKANAPHTAERLNAACCSFASSDVRQPSQPLAFRDRRLRKAI